MKLSNNLKTTLAMPVLGLLAMMLSPAHAAWLVDSSGNPLNRASTAPAAAPAPTAAPAPVASMPAPRRVMQAPVPKPEPVATGKIAQIVHSNTFVMEDDTRMVEVDKRQFDEEQRRLGRPLMGGQRRAPAPVQKPVAQAPAEVMNLQMNRAPAGAPAAPVMQAQPVAPAPMVSPAPVEKPMEAVKPSGGVMNLRMGG